MQRPAPLVSLDIVTMKSFTEGRFVPPQVGVLVHRQLFTPTGRRLILSQVRICPTIMLVLFFFIDTFDR